MKRASVLALVAAASVALATPALAADGNSSAAAPIAAKHVPNQVLVGFAPGSPAADRAAARSAVSAASSERLSPLASDAELWTLAPGRSVEDAIATLTRNPNIRYAEPNYILETAATSNDPSYTNGSLWGMYGDATSPANQFGSQAAEAWAAGATGTAETYVVVIDEGIQITHPDLAANTWTNPFDVADGLDNDGNGYVDDVNGWDFAGGNNSVYDGTSDDHGTHVAGTIGAVGGNGIGVAGVSWDVTMISAKFLGSTGGTTANAIKAVDYATGLKTKHGLNIVATSNSWGGGGFSQGLLDAIARGGAQGILFVAAAGNSATNNDATASYPSNYNCKTGASNFDCVVAVAAIASNGTLASFSQYGYTTVDLGAPGVGINSTVPSNSYASYQGTSMATPHVSGAVALCSSMSGGLRGAALKDALMTSTAATSSLAGKTVTGGRLDMGALATKCGTSTPPPPAGPSVSTMTPTSGPVGTPVTISGAGLTGATVKVGTTAPTPTSASDTGLTFNVPATLAQGSYPVTVTVGGSELSAGSFTVTVPPSEPRLPTWTRVNNSTARLSWTAPLTGAPITRYEVRFGTSTTWSSTTSTSINVRVKVGGTYTWSVRAVNAAGTGQTATQTFTFR